MEEDTAAPSAQSAEHFTQNQLSLLRRQIQHLKLINIRLKTAALQVLSPPSVAYNARGPRSTGTGTRTGKASARKKRKAPDEDEDDHVDHEDDSIINDDKEETPPPTSASEEELNSSIDEEITSESELSESSLDSATMLNGNRGVDGDDGPASPPLPRRTTPRASRNRRTVAILDIPSGDDNEDFDIIIDDDDNQTKNAANAATATTTTGKKKSQSLTQDKKLYKTTEAGAPTTDEIKLQALTPITVTWCPDSDADLVCSVCAEGESTDDVPILLCDGPGCDVAVHTACYGVGTVPKGEWLCDVCLDRNRNRNKGSVGATVGRGTKGRGDSSTAKAHKGKKTTMHDDEYPYRCILCPVLGGAMKQVTTFGPVVPPPTPSDSASSAWVHLCCALWSTEVIIRDAVKMKDVDVSGLAKERLALLCGCCRQRGSAPVQCAWGTCYRAVHVPCAYFRGFDVRLSLDGSGLVFCGTHSKERYAGVRRLMWEGKRFEEAHAQVVGGGSGAEEEGEEEEDGGGGGRNGAKKKKEVAYEQQRRKNVERINEAKRQLLGDVLKDMQPTE